MIYFSVFIIVLVLFEFDTVCGAYGSEYLTIEVKNKDLKSEPLHGMKLPSYKYILNQTLELQCKVNDKSKSVLEWTDEKNKISEKSCTEINDFKLLLEKLNENDNQTVFTCKTSNFSKNVTLVLDDRGSSRKVQEDGNNVCYNFVRNCAPRITQEEVLTRERQACPKKNMTGTTNNYNDTTESVQKITNPSNVSETSSKWIYAGAVILLFISLVIVTVCVCKFYNKIKEIINKLKNNEPIYAEPNVVVYAELQMMNDNPPMLSIRDESPYAEIIGVMTPAPAQPVTK